MQATRFTLRHPDAGEHVVTIEEDEVPKAFDAAVDDATRTRGGNRDGWYVHSADLIGGVAQPPTDQPNGDEPPTVPSDDPLLSVI